jgi:hypothetical protein
MQSLLDRDTFCTKCGYNLRGQVEPRCPECGEAFDPALQAPRPRRIDWVLVLVPGLLAAWMLPLLMQIGGSLARTLPDGLEDVLPSFRVVKDGGASLIECLTSAGLCFLLGAVFGLVLSMGATERRRLTWREVVLTGGMLVALAVALVLPAVLMDPFMKPGRFTPLHLLYMVTLYWVGPFTLGEWALAWAFGRRFNTR